MSMTNPRKSHGILWCFHPAIQAAAVAFRKSPREALDAAGSRGNHVGKPALKT